MGSNPTQALGVLFFLLAFALLAGAFAGGGMLLGLGFVLCLGASIFFFLKCKPWENKEEAK